MFLRVMESNIPIPIAVAIIEEPPYEMNGSVIPLVGIRCNVDAMLIIDCKPKDIARPEADKIINKLLSLHESNKERMTIVA